MATRRVQWHYSGNLHRLESRFDKGCYIFTYGKPRSELVYVGTATSRDGFMARWAQHLGDFRRGARTVWRPQGRSIRELMSAKHNEYEELSQKGLIWIPGAPDGSQFKPYYPNKWSYDEWWERWVEPHYLWNLEVFACPLESEREAKILETQLQIRLSEKNGVGYYTESQAQSWLGKREAGTKIQELESEFFEFDPIEREDSHGEKLLSNFRFL